MSLPNSLRFDQRWGAFALAAGALLVITAATALPGLTLQGGTQLRVWGAFWSSGWAAVHGANPFLAYPLTPAAIVPGQADVNLSPPAMLPLFAALSYLPPLAVAPWWIMGQAALMALGVAAVVLCAPVPVQSWRVTWALLVPHVSAGIWLGQDYPMLFTLCAAGWALMRAGCDAAAGFAIGALVACKPNFGLWPMYLLLAGAWRPALVAGVVAAALSIAPILVWGSTVYHQWLAAVALDQHWRLPLDVSIHGVLARAGLPGIGRALSAAAVVAGAMAARRLPADRAGALGLSVGVLASPLGWIYYAVFLTPAFLEGLWGGAVSVALFSIPPAAYVLAGIYGLGWLPSAMGFVAFVLVALALGRGAGQPSIAAPRRGFVSEMAA